MEFDGYAYQVRTKSGREFFCHATIRKSRTKAKEALSAINQKMAESGRPFLEPLELKKVRIFVD